MALSPRIKNISGLTFGRLTVVKFHSFDKWGQAKWLCKCSCGDFKAICGYKLRKLRTMSCGCYAKEVQSKRAKKHGYTTCNNGKATREYTAWINMRRRCNKTTGKDAKYYNNKGIKYCHEWENFEVFLKDMGECPDNYEIDRINNSIGYYKENCRWVDETTQSRNRDCVKPNW